jgi:hypothetical protein
MQQRIICATRGALQGMLATPSTAERGKMQACPGGRARYVCLEDQSCSIHLQCRHCLPVCGSKINLPGIPVWISGDGSPGMFAVVPRMVWPILNWQPGGSRFRLCAVTSTGTVARADGRGRRGQ